jgi:hypothetical protein
MCNEKTFHFCEFGGVVCCGLRYTFSEPLAHSAENYLSWFVNQYGKPLKEHRCLNEERRSFFETKCTVKKYCTESGFHVCYKQNLVCHGKKMKVFGDVFQCASCDHCVIFKKKKYGNYHISTPQKKDDKNYTSKQRKKCLKATKPRVNILNDDCLSADCSLKGCHFCDHCEGFVCCKKIFSYHRSCHGKAMPENYKDDENVSLRDHRCFDKFRPTLFNLDNKNCHFYKYPLFGCDDEEEHKGTHYCIIMGWDNYITDYFCHGEVMKMGQFGRLYCQNEKCYFTISECSECEENVDPFEKNHPNFHAECYQSHCADLVGEDYS